jgi:hypothetical protein
MQETLESMRKAPVAMPLCTVDLLTMPSVFGVYSLSGTLSTLAETAKVNKPIKKINIAISSCLSRYLDVNGYFSPPIDSDLFLLNVQ